MVFPCTRCRRLGKYNASNSARPAPAARATPQRLRAKSGFGDCRRIFCGLGDRGCLGLRRAVAWQGARRDHWSGILDGSNEAIASAGKRLDVARAFGRVAQSVAQPLDGCVEADIEVHESVRGPKLLAQFFSRDHLTRTLQQQGQDLKGLSGTPTTADQF